MEEDQHQPLVRQASRNRSQAEEDSPSHSRSHGKLPTSERKSHTSTHDLQHHHGSHSAHTEITTSSTVATSVIPAPINYNVNVQFDPATPQAGKPTRLSLVVTEQKVGEPIKQFDIIHDKLMHLIIVNREDLSHFAHIHPKQDEKLAFFI
jgi:hypothetical protein